MQYQGTHEVAVASHRKGVPRGRNQADGAGVRDDGVFDRRPENFILVWKLAQRPQSVPPAFLKQCEFTLPNATISEDYKTNYDFLMDMFHQEMAPSILDQVGMGCSCEV